MKIRTIFDLLVVALLFVILLLNNEIFVEKREVQTTINTYEMGLLPMIERTNKEKIMRMRTKYSSDVFQAGMNILIYGHPNMKEAQSVFEKLRSLGINSIALNFPFFQSDWQANEVSIHPEETPTNKELRQLIELAHSSRLSVMMKPIMDEQAFLASNRWRGQIQPKNPQRWFDSYEEFLLSYARLAESTNIKALNIGTELSSLQNQYQDRWMTLIENVRKVYSGKLLYSFNYDTVSEIPSIDFVPLLDHVGIDAYFPLDLPDNASIEMLEAEWKKQIDQLEDSLWEESIVITEAGIVPIAGAYRTPYAWSLSKMTYDPLVQANYYEATFNRWKPKIDGIYWWSITLGQDADEISYSPLTLPTEDVIKKHFLAGENNS